MKITIRYFAALREALGTGETLEVGEGLSVGGLRDALIARGGRHAELLSRHRALRAALDQTMAQDDDRLADGSEVAFFPPVTGG